MKLQNLEHGRGIRGDMQMFYVHENSIRLCIHKITVCALDLRVSKTIRVISYDMTGLLV